jgi:DNA-binding NarL/FixJ family response regulator
MAEVPFPQHHDMVEALASDRANQPFNMTVLPRRAWRDRPVANAHGSQPPGDREPEGERQRRPDGLDLTPRELSVIDLVRVGKPNKMIAAQLDMQENTVKVHVRNILKKLNAANRTHAAFVANRLLGQDAKPATLSGDRRIPMGGLIYLG